MKYLYPPPAACLNVAHIEPYVLLCEDKFRKPLQFLLFQNFAFVIREQCWFYGSSSSNEWNQVRNFTHKVYQWVQDYYAKKELKMGKLVRFFIKRVQNRVLFITHILNNYNYYFNIQPIIESLFNTILICQIFQKTKQIILA
ncbi:Hypothetical_protein [Hexamita inflata]|uniref:Hypothetical_protein n=1 Tax=Hexamita inflata TaxID=28002 RepID=A0AA86R121_9EUKA|nr:Hypothetical protein HINF_LOCUS51204 [Hexamita inflata]